MFCATLLTVRYASIPGILVMPPNGSPVEAGFSPMRWIIASIFLPVFAIATTNIVQGITSAPVGTTDIAESMNFRKTRLKITIRHILPNIRTQPLKISAVLLLPPMANASGDNTVRTARTTYLSPISKNSLIICTTSITPTMMASSQPASPGTWNVIFVSSGTCTVSGVSSSSITRFVMPKPMSQTWRENTRKNVITNVRANSDCGASPSKPSPDIIVFADWNTRLPSRSAQPRQVMILKISPVIGTAVSK